MTESLALTGVDELMKVAIALLETTEVDNGPVRLLGLALSNLDCEREPEEYVQLTINFLLPRAIKRT